MLDTLYKLYIFISAKKFVTKLKIPLVHIGCVQIVLTIALTPVFLILANYQKLHIWWIIIVLQYFPSSWHSGVSQKAILKNHMRLVSLQCTIFLAKKLSSSEFQLYILVKKYHNLF